MLKNEWKLFTERVTLRMCVAVLVLVLVGFACLYVYAQEGWWVERKVWRVVVQQLGGLLVVTAGLTFIWELIGKRAFLDEVLAKARLSRDIEFSGIIQVTDSFHSDVDWASYINRASKIDIFFAYGKSWRNTHFQEMRTAAQRKDTRIRVVLPDPDDEETVKELARRFSCQPAEVKDLIAEAEQYFKELDVGRWKGGNVEIWFLPAAPTFTFYRFDHVGVLALYSHRKHRVGVPTFVCEQGGTLYDYIRKELDAMIGPQNGLARKADE